jgi:glycosyltransferase involved in cell wall biosynthesis
MKSTPQISVVMSVYNGEVYLEEAIESILNQTITDFEFVIINDGSSDNSIGIIKHYATVDSRIKFVTHENIGLTKSLNIGINMSRGKYIARQDADDLSVVNRFEKQLPWLEEKKYDLCCSRAWLIDKKRVTPRIKYYFPKKLLIKISNPFIHGTYFIKKSIFDKLGGYDEEFRFAQDYKLMSDIMANGYKIKYLKEVLYKSRSPENSISVKHRLEQRNTSKELRWM